jgi:ornithine decarboxylase
MSINDDEPYFIIDLNELENNYNDWKTLLPTIIPYYAVKCNNNPHIIKHLYNLGCNFDCASKKELEQILNLNNYNYDKIIFAHPCKYSSHLLFAQKNNINLMTFDNHYELDKIKKYNPNASLILRLAIDDSKSKCKFNKKFGCKFDNIKNLLEYAKSINLNVIGFSFHVGSMCSCPIVYYNSLIVVKNAIEIASLIGFNINIIDIGGGFMKKSFKESAIIINKSIEELFKDTSIKFIAEPGRYMVESCQSLYLTIIGKKKIDNTFIYYINDSIYGSFNCIHFDYQNPEIIIDKYFDENHEKFNSIIFGNTCDSLDEIKSDIQLPELNINDKLYVKNFGAYTSSTSSESFNGYKVENFIINMS